MLVKQVQEEEDEEKQQETTEGRREAREMDEISGV